MNLYSLIESEKTQALKEHTNHPDGADNQSIGTSPVSDFMKKISESALTNSYLLERGSLAGGDNNVAKEINFAERACLQFEKFTRILELMNVGSKNPKIERLLKNMDRFASDINEVTTIIKKRHENSKIVEKEFLEFKREAEAKIRDLETQLARQIEKYNVKKDQMKEMKLHLSQSFKKVSSMENSAAGRLAASKMLKNPPQTLEKSILISKLIPKNSQEMAKNRGPGRHETESTWMNEGLTQSQTFSEMQNMNNTNKELLDMYSKLESEMMSKAEENDLLRNRVKTFSSKIERLLSQATTGDEGLNSLKMEIRGCLDESHDLLKTEEVLQRSIPDVKDYINRIEELQNELEQEKSVKSKLMREIELMKFKMRQQRRLRKNAAKKLSEGGAQVGNNEEESDSDEDDSRKETELLFESQMMKEPDAHQFRQSRVLEVCIQIVAGEIDRVFLVKQNAKGKTATEEVKPEGSPSKLNLINLDTPSDVIKLETGNSDKKKLDGVQDALTKASETPSTPGKNTGGGKLDSQIRVLKEIIDKQDVDLHSLKSKIRGLKYDLIDSKDRELKWYGKYMNLQRSSQNSNAGGKGASGANFLQASKLNGNGEIDLEASLMTIMEANEHLEEESAKILTENKALKVKVENLNAELFELQRKFERLGVSNETLQNELDFLRKRYRELKNIFLEKIEEQEKYIKRGGRGPVQGQGQQNLLVTEKEINAEFNMIEERQKMTDELIFNNRKSIMIGNVTQILENDSGFKGKKEAVRSENRKLMAIQSKYIFDYWNMSKNKYAREIISRGEKIGSLKLFSDAVRFMKNGAEMLKRVCLITSKFLSFGGLVDGEGV